MPDDGGGLPVVGRGLMSKAGMPVVQRPAATSAAAQRAKALNRARLSGKSAPRSCPDRGRRRSVEGSGRVRGAGPAPSRLLSGARVSSAPAPPIAVAEPSDVAGDERRHRDPLTARNAAGSAHRPRPPSRPSLQRGTSQRRPRARAGALAMAQSFAIISLVMSVIPLSVRRKRCGVQCLSVFAHDQIRGNIGRLSPRWRGASRAPRPMSAPGKTMQSRRWVKELTLTLANRAWSARPSRRRRWCPPATSEPTARPVRPSSA